MNLYQHYDSLWNSTKSKFEVGEFGIDSQLFDENDRRYGVTLLIRPSQSVKNSISAFLEDIKAIEPNLYLYPQSDMHLTVLSIISCYDGFNLDQIDVGAHRDCIQASLAGIKPFSIHMKGITAASSAIMIQGFPKNDELNLIRESLREHYKNSNLQSRMDVRYAITTSHSTVIRFPEKPENSGRLLQVLEKYRDFDFGSFEVNVLEFVYNDWYQRAELVQELGLFELK